MLLQSDKSKHIEESFNDLLKEAEKGNYLLVMNFLSTNNYSIKSKDKAFRKCLRNYPKEKKEQEEYLGCFRGFIENYEDFNYRNDDESGETILMEVCQLGLKQVVEMIFKHIKESEIPIDVNIKDNNEEVAVHKLVCSQNFPNEESRIEVLNILIQNGADIHKENKQGNNALSMALQTGNSRLSEELIKLGANVNHILNSSHDSMLHCAILGKNPLCLQLLIDQVDEKIKKWKNYKGELPVDLAAKMGLNKHMQILGEQPNNISNKLLSMIQPLEEFRKGNYKEAFRLLLEIKSNKEISLSLEWNIILVEYVIELSENESNLNIETLFDKFKNFFKSLKIENLNLPENSLLFYNMAIYYYKIGNYKKIIETCLKNEILQKSLNHFEWILYVNSLFLLLRVFIDLRQLKVVSILIDNIEEFLNLTQKEKHKQTLKDNIGEYLSNKEVINVATSLDESFCVLALFKSYKFILENKSDEAKKQIKEYKRIYTTSKLKDQLPIFNTTKNFYHFLKIKIDYLNNSFFKCYKHLNSLYTTIKPDEGQTDSQLFYLNAIGILNLRQKKYTLAQFFFKNCLFLLKKNFKKFPEFSNFIFNVKYNIGLCLFYEKKYEKAFRVFNPIKQNLSYYPYLKYRMGLCLLEMEMSNLRTESLIGYNEVVEKLIGYTTEVSNEMKEKIGLNNLSSLSNLSLSPIRSQDDTTRKGEDVSIFNTNLVSSNLITFANVQRIILKNNSRSSKSSTNNLIDAIKCFKDTIILLKDNIYYKKEISDVINFYSDKENNLSNTSNNMTEIKSYQNIVTSAYLNLIFSLILTEDWNEVLFYADEFEKSQFYNKEVVYTIDNYKIEAYLALNQHVQILEILKKNMMNNNFSYNSLEFKGTFFNQSNKMLYPEINYKLALYINIIKMNFITNNLVEVEKGINSILALFNVNLSINNGVITQNDLPPFILNLLIYYYLIKENYEVALNIIKRRKIPMNFAQNLQQPQQSKISFNMK